MQQLNKLRMNSATRPAVASRRGRLAVQANEGFCRDKVAVGNREFKGEGKVFKVTFEAGGGKTQVVDCPDDMYILDAAEKAGLDLPATCRGGICGACVVRVRSGTVDQSDIPDLSFTLEQSEIDQGMALICMSRAKSDTVVETQCDWGYSLGVCEWQGATGKFEGTVDPLMGKKWDESKK